MTTIVIHGTMVAAGAQHATWWWNSRHTNGFLQAIAEGLGATRDDVWTVSGRPVAEIPELQKRWSPWTGGLRAIQSYRGHFVWSGQNMHIARKGEARNLARYVTAVHALAPTEPIRLIAHSHGCNLVKHASQWFPSTLPPIRAVFLACPHFETQMPDGFYYPYRLAVARFSSILNLYSAQDTVQTALAERIPTLTMSFGKDMYPPVAYRVERDPQAAGLYENVEVSTEDTGVRAHTALHGSTVGELAGLWLRKRTTFAAVLAEKGIPVCQIPRGDFGE